LLRNYRRNLAVACHVSGWSVTGARLVIRVRPGIGARNVRSKSPPGGGNELGSGCVAEPQAISQSPYRLRVWRPRMPALQAADCPDADPRPVSQVLLRKRS
jgi:hypothetical protein